MTPQIILLFLLPVSNYFSLTSSEIVPGTCPTAMGNEFNCSGMFKQTKNVFDLLIYGFLPTENTEVSAFSFDFPNASITNYYVRITCDHLLPKHIEANASEKTNMFETKCGTNNPFNPLTSIR